MSDLLDAVLDGPRGRGRPALDRRRRPRRGRAGGRRRRPPAGTSPTQIAHLRLDRRGRRPSPPPTRRLGRGRARGDRGPDRLRRRRRARGRHGSRRRRCWPAGARRATALADGAARAPGRREDAVVRPADVAGLDGDRAVHGDLGARRSTSYEALGVDARDHRPDPARRPPRRADPRLRVLRARARAAGRGVPDRAARAVRRGLDLGAGGRRADGDAGRRTTSACWSPSAGTATTPTWWPTARTPSAGSASRRRSPARPVRAAGEPDGGLDSSSDGDPTGSTTEPTCCGSATAPASTATGSRRCARCSRAATGGLDVLTGDYLAELTMLILGKDTMKDPSLGYARTFVRQVEDCLGLALERGVKIVANAGGLNPAGLADRLREVATGLGLDAGDRPRRGRRPARPRGRARLRGRADRERLPRRLRHRRRARPAAPTSSSPAGSPTPRWSSGPAVAHFGWTPTSYDELAGAVVAGPRARVRHPGHRRQLLRLPRACRTTRPAARLPARRDRRRRLVRDHQARRHRRRGHGRHGHRAAGLRDPVDALPRPRRHHAARHRPARRRRARTGSRSPASAARRRPSGSRSASTSSAGSATPWSSC